MTPERDDFRATSIIVDGGSPRDVAVKFPIWFVRYHVGLVALWENINRRPWRVNE